MAFHSFSYLCSGNMDKGQRAKTHIYNASLESQSAPGQLCGLGQPTNLPEALVFSCVNRVRLSPALESHMDDSMRESIKVESLGTR